METAFDLLNRLSDLRNDIHESTQKITSMLETIQEERSVFSSWPPHDTSIKNSSRRHRHHQRRDTKKSIENDLKRKNVGNFSKGVEDKESGIDRKKARCG